MDLMLIPKFNLYLTVVLSLSLKSKKMRNSGCELDIQWLKNVSVNAWSVYDAVKCVPYQKYKLNSKHRTAWLLRAVSCTDLTTLSGDDTRGNVFRLCQKAITPIKPSLLKELDFKIENFTTAAVCVYPARVPDVVYALKNSFGEKEVRIAAVATGFPSAQYDIKSRLLEIHHAVENGANEIDVVINRDLVLKGDWKTLYEELKLMKEACQEAEMKTILATGELSTFQNIYKASLIAMMAGTNFIKTSTGKETVNATLPVGLVMMRAIRDYCNKTQCKVGFKAAGGIRTSEDALNWLILVKRELGKEWLNKDLFRIGASGLLGDIEKKIFHFVYGRYPASYELTLG